MLIACYPKIALTDTTDIDQLSFLHSKSLKRRLNYWIFLSEWSCVEYIIWFLIVWFRELAILTQFRHLNYNWERGSCSEARALRGSNEIPEGWGWVEINEHLMGVVWMSSRKTHLRSYSTQFMNKQKKHIIL